LRLYVAPASDAAHNERVTDHLKDKLASLDLALAVVAVNALHAARLGFHHGHSPFKTV
jgi:hypothetical protein